MGIIGVLLYFPVRINIAGQTTGFPLRTNVATRTINQTLCSFESME